MESLLEVYILFVLRFHLSQSVYISEIVVSLISLLAIPKIPDKSDVPLQINYSAMELAYCSFYAESIL